MSEQVFSIVGYNVHSMMDFETRINHLLNELSHVHWDVLVLSETWREQRQESFVLNEWGHKWFGSGGTRRERGIGFLLHKRWTETRFKPTSERTASLDVQISADVRLRIMGVYMPHTGYSDSAIEEVYAELDNELATAHAAGHRVIIAGDMNAQIGGQTELDDPAIIGHNPAPSRNGRGDLLLQWCTLRCMVIANSFGMSNFSEIWTYTNSGIHRQLDYILVSQPHWKFVRSCRVLYEVDIGSDHRPVILDIMTSTHPRKTSARKLHLIASWKPGVEYVHALQCRLQDTNVSASDTVGCRLQMLQDAVIHSVKATSQIEPTPRAIPDEQLQALIHKRRQLTSSFMSSDQKKAERRLIGKQIQTLIRQRLNAKKLHKIKNTLAEFRNLKSLSSLIGQRVSTSIVEMKSGGGLICTEKSDIAEVFACFYEELFRSRRTAATEYTQAGTSSVSAFTMEELQTALASMRNGRACDTAGVRAEMLKVKCPILHETILALFNDVIQPDALLPEDWRKSRIIVIFKKGGPQLFGNY